MEAALQSVELSDQWRDWLRPVRDPELGLPLVDLGLIYGVAVTTATGDASVQMTLTSPACPAADVMIQNIKNRMLEYEGIKSVDVQIVWEPKWDPATMASEEAKEELGIW